MSTQYNPQRRRGPSPVPQAAFTMTSRNVISKLWGPRLSPGITDETVEWAFKEMHCQLPDRYHKLLCIGMWMFQANPSTNVDWNFYRFAFHEALEEDRELLYSKMKDQWNLYAKEDLNIQEVENEWRGMIWAIGEGITERLSTREFPLCSCNVTQPHSNKDLPAILQDLDASRAIEEKAHLVAAACTSLRVADMLEEEDGGSGEASHRSWTSHRQVITNSLKELAYNRALSWDIRTHLDSIIVYEEDRSARERVADLIGLASLKI